MRNPSTAAAGTAPDTNKTSSSTSATRWWQWMLLYPSLAVTIVTAVPTWIDHVQAMKIGVNSRDLAQAQEQRRLWETNLECAQVQEISSESRRTTTRRWALGSAPRAMSSSR